MSGIMTMSQLADVSINSQYPHLNINLDTIISPAAEAFVIQTKSPYFITYDTRWDERLKAIQNHPLLGQTKKNHTWNQAHFDLSIIQDNKLQKNLHEIASKVDAEAKKAIEQKKMQDEMQRAEKGSSELSATKNAAQSSFLLSNRFILYQLANGKIAKPDAIKEQVDKTLDAVDLSTELQESASEVYHFLNNDLKKLTNPQVPSKKEERLKKFQTILSKFGFGEQIDNGTDYALIAQGQLFESIRDKQKTIEQTQADIQDKGLVECLHMKTNSNSISTTMKTTIDSWIKKYPHLIGIKNGHYLSILPYSRLEADSQIITTLDFFETHWELLQNSDYQTFCLLNLCAPGFLEKQLLSTPQLAEQLLNFIREGLEAHQGMDKNNTTAHFFVKLAFYFRRYMEESKIKDKLSPFSESLAKQLDTFLKKQANELKNLDIIESTAQLRQIYIGYILHKGLELQKGNKVDLEDMALLLTANVCYALIPAKLSGLVFDPNEEKELKSQMEKIRIPLKTYFSNLHETELKKIINTILANSGFSKLYDVKDYSISGEFPVLILTNTKQESVLLDLIQGKITSGNAAWMKIPNTFYTKDFKKYFGVESVKGKVYTHANMSICEFVEKRGTFQVIVSEGKTSIRKKLGPKNVWYEKSSAYLRDAPKESPFSPLLVEEGKEAWRLLDLKNEHYIITNQNNQEETLMEVNNISKKEYIEKCDTLIKAYEEEIESLEVQRKQLYPNEEEKIYHDLKLIKEEEISLSKKMEDLYKEIGDLQEHPKLKEIEQLEAQLEPIVKRRLAKLKVLMAIHLKRFESIDKNLDDEEQMDNPISQKLFEIKEKINKVNAEKESISEKNYSRLSDEDLEKGKIPLLKIWQLENKQKSYFLIKTEEGLNSDVIKLISSVENPVFIEVWKKNVPAESKDVPLIIKLPRYNLELFAQKDKQGNIQLVLKSDPQYCLDLSNISTPIAGFKHFLEFKLINNAAKERMIWVPKQYIVVNREEPKEKQSQYYKLELDTEHSVAMHRVANQRLDEWMTKPGYAKKSDVGSFYGASIQQWKLSGTGESYLIKMNTKQQLVPETTEACLYLAYLALGYKEPYQALHYLKMYKKQGGLKGNTQEIELLRRILVELPATLGRKKSEALEDKARVATPEIDAVKAYAAYLIADYKHLAPQALQLDKDLMEHEKMNFSLRYQKLENNALLNFWNENFLLIASNIAVRYIKNKDNIPKDIRVKTEEFNTLWNYLKLTIESEPKVNQKAVQEEKLSAEHEKLRQDKIEILPEKHTFFEKGFGVYRVEEGIDTWDLNCLNQAMKGTFGRSGRSLLPDYPQVKPTELKATTSHEVFLTSFKNFYELALEQDSKETADEKQALLIFLETRLRILTEAKKLSSEHKSNLVDKLIILLYYVIKNPNEPWPKWSSTSEMIENLSSVYEKTLALSKNNPLSITLNLKSLSLPTASESKTPIIQALPRENVLINKSTTPHQSLYQQFGFQTLFNQVDSLVKETVDLKHKHKTLLSSAQSANEPFFKKEAENFQKEINKGQELNQIERLKKEIYAKSLNSDSFHITNFSNCVNKSISDATKIVKDLQSELLNLANLKINGREAVLTTRLELLGKTRIPVSFEMLTVLYLQGDFKKYRELTLLNNAEIHELHNRLHTSFLQATHLKHLERCAKLTLNWPQSLHSLGEELTAIRHYDPSQHPELLVFEYQENILLKNKQVKILENFIKPNKEGGYSNAMIQLPMGGGKSKVIMPLLALKKATGNNLSMIVVPSSLFDTNVADLQKTSHDLFGQSGYPFEFHRDSPCTVYKLTLLKEKLNSIIKNKGFMISTPESIQSLELKYLELLAAPQQDSPEWAKQIETITDILQIFNTKTDVLIDEIDNCTQSKRELNYTLGRQSTLDNDHLQTLIDVYRLFPKVSSTILVQQKPFSLTLEEVLYRTKLPISDLQWQDLFAELAKVLVFDKLSPLADIVAELSKGEKESLILYLQDKSKQEPKFIKNLNKSEVEKLSLIKGQVSQLLPLTLKKKPNEYYGYPKLPQKKELAHIAIPYLGNDSPNEKAQFGNPDETANFSIQLQMRTPLSLAILTEMIADFYLRTKAELDIDATLRGNIEKTKAAQEFSKVTKLKLSDFNPNDDTFLKQQYASLSQNTTLKSYCLVHYILNHIPCNPYILRSNAQNFLAQFRSVQGITGTPWNYRTLSMHLSFNPAENRGMDGQVLDNIIAKKTKVILAPESKPTDLLNNIFKKHADQRKIRSLIDVGALFEGISNVQVASELAQFFKIEAEKEPEIKNTIRFIFYFNDQNKLTVLPIEGGNPQILGTSDKAVIDEWLGNQTPKGTTENCFMYYDQIHTRGVDFKQANDSTGLVTFGADTTEVDFVQAVMRMRGFSDSQNIEIIIPKAVYAAHPEIPPKDWSCETVLKIALENQLLKTAEDHFRSGEQKMHHLIRNYLLKHMNSLSTLEKKKVFDLINPNIFIMKMILVSDKLYRGINSERETKQILREMAKSYYNLLLNNWKKLNLPEAEVAPIRKILLKIAYNTAKKCIAITKTPKKIQDSQVEMQREVEMESQKQKQKEQEKEKEKEKERVFDKIPVIPRAFKEWPETIDLVKFDFVKSSMTTEKSPKIISVNEMLQSGPRAKEFKFKFDNNLLVSENYAFSYEGQVDLLDQYRKPIFFFMVIEDDKKNLQTVIITQEEASYFKKQIEQNQDGLQKANKNIWIVSPRDHYLCGTTKSINNIGFAKLKEQINYLNGDLDILAASMPNLNWVKQNPTEKLKFIEDSVLNSFPEKRKFVVGLKQKLAESAPAKTLIFRKSEITIMEKTDKTQKPGLKNS